MEAHVAPASLEPIPEVDYNYDYDSGLDFSKSPADDIAEVAKENNTRDDAVSSTTGDDQGPNLDSEALAAEICELINVPHCSGKSVAVLHVPEKGHTGRSKKKPVPEPESDTDEDPEMCCELVFPVTTFCGIDHTSSI